MTIPRIIVCAPPYRETSAGVRCLHRLAHDLLGLGVDCRTLVLGDDGGDVFAHHLAHRAVYDPSEVAGAAVVYPEVNTGHPLAPYRPGRVVRWLLNREALLTGLPMDAGPDDLIVTHSRLFHPTAPPLRIPFLDRLRYSTRGALPLGCRTTTLAYAGRGGAGEFPPGSVLLSHATPRTLDELADLYRTAKVLYTRDPFSAMSHEALLCGCPIRALGWGQWTRDECLRYELPCAYRLALEETQDRETVGRARDRLVDLIVREELDWPGQLETFVGMLS